MANKFVSPFSLQLLRQVKVWIAAMGEVFVVTTRDGGSFTTYRIVTSLREFYQLASALPPKSEIFIFREKQLPLRGRADKAFLQQALDMHQEPGDYLLLSLEGRRPNTRRSFHGDTAGELEAMFGYFHGKQVAFGPFPRWFESDSDNMLSARLPLREVRVIFQEVRSGERAILDPEEAGTRSKLGGVPYWIQGDDTPNCPSCGNPMMFISQIDSIDKGKFGAAGQFRFGDVGVIYTFYCFECGATASVFQGH